jgi:hypothetical protein
MCTVTTGLHLVGKLPGRLDYIENLYVVMYVACYVQLTGRAKCKALEYLWRYESFVYTPHFSLKFRIDKIYQGFSLRSAVGSVLLQKPNSNTLLTMFDPTDFERSMVRTIMTEHHHNASMYLLCWFDQRTVDSIWLFDLNDLIWMNKFTRRIRTMPDLQITLIETILTP